jgi:hypothetical protein
VQVLHNEQIIEALVAESGSVDINEAMPEPSFSSVPTTESFYGGGSSAVTFYTSDIFTDNSSSSMDFSDGNYTGVNANDDSSNSLSSIYGKEIPSVQFFGSRFSMDLSYDSENSSDSLLHADPIIANLQRDNLIQKKILLRALDQNMRQSSLLRSITNQPDDRNLQIAAQAPPSVKIKSFLAAKIPEKPKRTGTRIINKVPHVISSAEFIAHAESLQQTRDAEEERKDQRRQVLAIKRKIKVEADEEKKKAKKIKQDEKENQSVAAVKKSRGRLKKNSSAM